MTDSTDQHPECCGEVYNPLGLSDGHLKCRGCGGFFHPKPERNSRTNSTATDQQEDGR